MRVSDPRKLASRRVYTICCLVVCLTISGIQTTQAAAREDGALDTSIVARVKAIEIRQDSLLLSTRSVHGVKAGENLSHDTDYLVAKRQARERASEFNYQLASDLSLSSNETRQFLAIVDSAQEYREVRIDRALKLGKDAYLDSLKLLGHGTHEMEPFSPRDVNQQIEKLLAPKRFQEYLFAKEHLFESRFHKIATQGDMVVTGDTELTDHHYGSIEIAADNITLDCNGHVIVNTNWLSSSPGISIEDRSNVTLHDCIVHFFDIGVYIADSTNIHVENTQAMGGIGYRVEDSSNVDLVRNVALHNTGEGFAVRQSSSTFFWENSAVQNSGDGFDENDGDSAYYLRNDAYNNGTNGFELDFASSPVYWENWVFANGQHGISLDAVDDALIHENEIVVSSEDGLRLDDESGVGTVNSTVSNNHSTGNGDRAAHQCGSICTGNIYRNNWFDGPTNNIP